MLCTSPIYCTSIISQDFARLVEVNVNPNFNEIYLRYKKRVYGYLMKRVKTEQSDDLFQQVFSRLHEKRYLFKQGDPFAPWFFTLIKNLVIDFYRKNKIEFVELDSDPEYEESSKVDLELFKKHEVLYLKFVDGHSYKELEEHFKTPAATLRKRVSRVINKIKDKGSLS